MRKNMFHQKRFLTAIIAMLLCSMLLSCTAQAAAVMGVGAKARNKAHFGKVYRRGTSSGAAYCLGSSYGNSISLQGYGLDTSLALVHGMYYEAKTTSKVRAQSADSKRSSVTVNRDTTVIVLYLGKKAVCRLKNGRTVEIPKKKLKVSKYIYNSSVPYSDKQIIKWVSQNNIKSPTKYMFVVSKYNQHGWILQKKGGKWKAKYVMKVSTGAHTNGNLPNDCYGLNSCAIRSHYIHDKRIGGRGISYASTTGGNQIHIGGEHVVGNPHTHGCIAMTERNLNFVYWYLPYGTRVVLF